MFRFRLSAQNWTSLTCSSGSYLQQVLNYRLIMQSCKEGRGHFSPASGFRPSPNVVNLTCRCACAGGIKFITTRNSELHRQANNWNPRGRALPSSPQTLTKIGLRRQAHLPRGIPNLLTSGSNLAKRWGREGRGSGPCCRGRSRPIWGAPVASPSLPRLLRSSRRCLPVWSDWGDRGGEGTESVGEIEREEHLLFPNNNRNLGVFV